VPNFPKERKERFLLTEIAVGVESSPEVRMEDTIMKLNEAIAAVVAAHGAAKAMKVLRKHVGLIKEQLPEAK
jgi:hypothetical protein